MAATALGKISAELAAPSVKQHLAALRMLFDYLVVGQVLPHNPAQAVRGPRLGIRTGKTPVLQDGEPAVLLAAIGEVVLIDLRVRALLSVLLYSFSRVSAAVGLLVIPVARQEWQPRVRVRDYEHQRRRPYLALQEKGGQHRGARCTAGRRRPSTAYLEASGLGPTPEAPLFQSFDGRPASSRG